MSTARGNWLLVDRDPLRSLGGALVWFDRHGSDGDERHLVLDESDAFAAAVLSRRAALFADPPTVRLASGTTLERVEPAPPAPSGDVPAPEAELFAPVLAQAGLEVVVEDGVLRGEVLGLEVARVAPADDDVPPDLAEALAGLVATGDLVVDEGPPPGGDPEPGSLRLRVGVGRFDQEASELVHRHRPAAEVLTAAAELVRRYRHAGAPHHPLNQLVPERWLRRAVLAHPDLVGASQLRPVGPVPPRANLRERSVAPMVGTDPDGRPLVVVASHGVDLDAVPAAADARLTYAPGAHLVVAVPERDVHPATVGLAAALREPAEVVGIPGDWEALA